MSDRPSVSIVIPTYQNAAYVAEALSSALSQTYTDLEVVVSDHSSTDGTLDVVRRFEGDPRLRVLDPLPTGGGAPRNFQRVTDAARGDLVKLLPGDDVLHPDLVSRQVKALAAHPSAVLAACRRDLVDVHGRPLLRGRGLGSLTGLVPGPDAIRALVRAGTNLLGEPGCVLIRRPALEAIGGWQADQPYLIDQATYMRLLRDGDLYADTATLAQFRISATQWSNKLARQQAAQARAIHHRTREALPSVVSGGDVRRGDLMVSAVVLQRRLAYKVWARRMRHG